MQDDSGEQPYPGLAGCDVPGHPNNHLHDCAAWDEAAAGMQDWEIPGRDAASERHARQLRHHHEHHSLATAVDRGDVDL